ncbi:unnamed protein product [Ilex paraguariensis]|uniref:Uncharacterized protein n=1 Tax=Ilex paraguariensis TaxID=185542 RepID=A0ABC8U5I2_9AQUA
MDSVKRDSLRDNVKQGVKLKRFKCNLPLFIIELNLMYMSENAAHQEALKKEIERLRQVYYQQNLNKMDNATPPQSQPQSSVSDVKGPMEKEQLVN